MGPFETQERNFNFPRMFAKHRQMRPFFHNRQWSQFDDPWWDYPMVPRMSMYEHPFSPNVETSVIPHDATNVVVVGGSTEVTNNENEFKIRLDVSNFRVEDMTVKTVNDRLKVHAKHEERQDDHGF